MGAQHVVALAGPWSKIDSLAATSRSWRFFWSHCNGTRRSGKSCWTPLALWAQLNFLFSDGDAATRTGVPHVKESTMKNKSLIVGLLIVVVMAAGGYGLYRLGMNHAMRTSGATSDAAAAASTTAGAQKPGDVDSFDRQEGAVLARPHGAGPEISTSRVSRRSWTCSSCRLRRRRQRKWRGCHQSTGAAEPRRNVSQRSSSGSQTRRWKPSAAWLYNERDVAVVQARSNGFLERLYVRAPLDAVRKGQPLAELYVPDWVAAQEEYLSAKRIGARSEAASLAGLADAAAQRMRLAGMSEDQIRAVETGGKVQPRLTITAPIGGVVGELTAREGMTVMAGAPLFRLNGLSTVWVNAEVPEASAAQVRPGNPVEARTPAAPGAVFKGKVERHPARSEPRTRTIKARIELANPGGQLVPECSPPSASRRRRAKTSCWSLRGRHPDRQAQRRCRRAGRRQIRPGRC